VAAVFHSHKKDRKAAVNIFFLSRILLPLLRKARRFAQKQQATTSSKQKKLKVIIIK